MDTYQFIASLASSLALPLAVVLAALIFRRQIGALIGRIRKLDALGTHTEFDPDDAAPAVVEAAAKASEPSRGDVSPETAGGPLNARIGTPPVQDHGLFARARSLLHDEPRQAVGVAYAVVDEVLRTSMSAAGVQTPGGARQSIELAREAGLISGETARAMTSLLGQRNLAMHNHPDEVSSEDAATYLTLADSVAYSVQADQYRVAGRATASGEITGHKSI